MTGSKTIRITNGIVCCPDRLIKGMDILIQKGRLRLIKTGEKNKITAQEIVVDVNGQYVLPAFTDIHIHGGALFEFTMGQFDPETGQFDAREKIYEKSIPCLAKFMASHGVANAYLGTCACSNDQMHFVHKQLRRYMDSSMNGRDGSVIKGSFLEGVFFNPSMAGAQNPEYTSSPSIERFRELDTEGVIRIVNVVPDYGEASMHLIRYLTDCGITVGAGHTNASGNQIEEAVRNGLKYCIHFTNGPTGNSFKPFDGGGAIEGMLRIPDIYVELILDGYHVNFAYVRDIIARKGIYRIIASTDAMFATGAKEVSKFSMSGIAGKVSKDRRYVCVQNKTNTLFSSVLTMDVAFSNILSLLTRRSEGIWYTDHPLLSFQDAFLAASRICSTNVNEMLRMYGHRDQETGTIENGKWADLIIGIVEGESGDYQLDIKRVFVRGVEIPFHDKGKTYRTG